MTSQDVALITIVSGRHGHLQQQRRGVELGRRKPELHVVISMGDPDIPAVVGSSPGTPRVVIETMPSENGRLRLGAARNLGAEVAIADGAGTLIFLDVDCIPGSQLVHRYAAAVAAASGPALFSGPVAYLPPPPPPGYDLGDLDQQAAAHPARPVPDEDEVLPAADHRLFWSLSFAASASTWSHLGGFCDLFDGYGAEDTDFGQIAAREGAGLHWVGGAWAYHQHHPTSDPPVQHLHDILRNAGVFKDRWGWWPMRGWLTSFQEMGLAEYDSQRDLWIAVQVDV